MTLRNLITSNNYKLVFNRIKHLYYNKSTDNEVVEADVGFRSVWDGLIQIPTSPEVSNFFIFVSQVYDDLNGEKFIDVSLRDPVADSIFSMDLSCWSEIIDLEIEDAVGLSEHDMLAHILWQISYWGFGQSGNLLSKEKLAKRWKLFKKEFKDDFNDLV